MVAFRLQLLGTFQALANDAPVTGFRSDKARALLAYLALSDGRSHPRDTLATLLWGDYDQKSARASLRQTLSNLRQAAAPLLQTTPPLLQITPQTVSLNTDHPAIWVDVVAFRHLLTQAAQHDHPDPTRCPHCRQWLQTAVSLYHGDFLTGLPINDAPEFHDWQLLQQETLHQQALHALQTLAASYAAIGDLTRQAETLRHLLHLLPWQENAHRQLMDVLARAGQRPAALAQYERCRQILADELGVEPAAETTALYRLIQAESLPPAAQVPPRRDASRHNLPPPTTPLIGRDALLAEIATTLHHPNTRLLTLLGPGGVGKTRLALAAARQALPDFADGVWFVQLADVSLPAPEMIRLALATAVIDQIGLSMQQPDDAWTTLTAYLHHKHALLILDNLEHLLPSATTAVTELLTVAPQLTILITSQARLRTRQEVVQSVTGLALPAANALSLETAGHSDSIALFAERAGRTLAGFQLDAANLLAVADICHLVDGLPLAIELAATLVEHFAPEEIAATLRDSITLLAESPGAADLPPRQQSITAVFEYAWRLLIPAEQTLLAQLSLFRGEFSRDMALAVSQGSLAALAALVDKSLLRVARPGRYTLHALVRHFAAAALRAQPPLLTAAQQRFCQEYAAFLQHHYPQLRGPQQTAAATAVLAELDNLRLAWDTAVAAAAVEQLAAMAPPLAAFFVASGKMATGVAFFSAAAERLASLPAPTQITAELDTWRALYLGEMGQMETAVTLLQGVLTRLEPATDTSATDTVAIAHARYVLGNCLARIGQLESGIIHLRAAQETFTAVGDDAALAATLSALGYAWESLGEYEQAQETYARSLALLRQTGAPQSLSKGLNNYGLLLYRLGDYATAAAALREAVTLNEAGGNRPGLGASLANLGLVLAAQSEYANAQATYERALAIQQDEGNQMRMAILLNNMGDVAIAQENYEMALTYLQESLAIKEEMGNERGMAFSLVHLGHAYRQLAQPAASTAAYHQALMLAQKLEMKPLLLAAFVGVAALALAQGKVDAAQQMVWLAAEHPASWQRVRDEAGAMAAAHDLRLPPPQPLPELEAVTAVALQVTAVPPH